MKYLIATVAVITCLFSVNSGLSNEEAQPNRETTTFTRARLFTGAAISADGTRAPMVVTVLEKGKGEVVKIQATFFAPKAVSLFVPRKDITINKDNTLFKAVTKDPRGFNVSWSAEIKNGKISGEFKQPYDTGKLVLVEAKEPAGNN